MVDNQIPFDDNQSSFTSALESMQPYPDAMPETDELPKRKYMPVYIIAGVLLLIFVIAVGLLSRTSQNYMEEVEIQQEIVVDNQAPVSEMEQRVEEQRLLIEAVDPELLIVPAPVVDMEVSF